MSNSAQDFAKIWKNKMIRVKRVLRRLPREIGNEALKYFMAGYKKEQTPEGKPWKPRQANGSGSRRTRRGLLVKSGRLRKSIRLTKITSERVTIGTNVPYAKYHNQGTDKLPQRKFIGKSAALQRRLERMVKIKILWALRG